MQAALQPHSGNERLQSHPAVLSRQAAVVRYTPAVDRFVLVSAQHWCLLLVGCSSVLVGDGVETRAAEQRTLRVYFQCLRLSELAVFSVLLDENRQ